MSDDVQDSGWWLSENLPESWNWASFGEIFEDVTSSKKKLKQQFYLETGTYPVIDQGQDVIGGYHDDDSLAYDGQLPVVIFGDHSRCVKFIETKFIQGADGVKVLKPTSAAVESFAYWTLSTIQLPDKGYSRHFKVLRASKFPVAPLNEQRRIVATIEALKARSQRVKEALEAIFSLLDQFRQSVLAAAFRGDLTADWRENNPDVEPVSKVISLLRTPDPEPELDVFEKSANHELPSSWMWVPLGKLGSLMGGGTPSKDNPNFWNGCIPWVSPKDMKRDRISSSIDHISEEALNSSSAKKIPKGSILFVVRGMILNHTFPVAITDVTVTVNQDMKALIPEVTQMNEYLLIANKFISKKILFCVKAATHGTRRLETPILKNWAIPIPPLEEQQEIVQRVNTLLETASRIEKQCQDAKAYLDQLDQSILAKAFRGKLVPQDPNDEPAFVLLERIHTERAKREAEAKAAKKSTGKTTGQRSRKAKQQDSESIQLELPGVE